jgi:hypothetical protein
LVAFGLKGLLMQKRQNTKGVGPIGVFSSQKHVGFPCLPKKNKTGDEKTEILQSLFRTYVKQTKRLSEEIGIDKKKLEEPFKEEMKSNA